MSNNNRPKSKPQKRKRKARFRLQLAPRKKAPPKPKPHPQQPMQQPMQQHHTQQPMQQHPTQRQNQPKKPKPRRRRKKMFRKYSELNKRERETYLNRKQKQLLKQERKLQKSLQRTKLKKQPQSKPKKRKLKDPYAIDYNTQPQQGYQKKRKSKKRHKKNYTLYYILLFILSSITVYCLSITIWFEIEEIVVTGDTDISYEEIINISGIQLYENLVKVSEKAVSQSVRDAYITIETVELNKKFPNKVEIEVTMATPKALLYYDKLYYTLSHSDRIISFTTSNYHNNNLISFIGGDLEGMDLGYYLADVDLNYLESIDRLLTAIDDNQFKGITFVDVSNISDIRFYADGLYEIKAGGFTEISYKLHCAKWIINLQDEAYDQKGIIDVSIDNGKYYFRPALEVSPDLW